MMRSSSSIPALQDPELGLLGSSSTETRKKKLDKRGVILFIMFALCVCFLVGFMVYASSEETEQKLGVLQWLRKDLTKGSKQVAAKRPNKRSLQGQQLDANKRMELGGLSFESPYSMEYMTRRLGPCALDHVNPNPSNPPPPPAPVERRGFSLAGRALKERKLKRTVGELRSKREQRKR